MQRQDIAKKHQDWSITMIDWENNHSSNSWPKRENNAYCRSSVFFFSRHILHIPVILIQSSSQTKNWPLFENEVKINIKVSSFLVQFRSVAQSCPTLCDPMNCSMPGIPVHHQLPESTQTHVHWVSDAIQTSHPLLSPSPLAFNLSQHQGLFKWVSYSHQVAKVLEFQLQHQSYWWILRTDFL